MDTDTYDDDDEDGGAGTTCGFTVDAEGANVYVFLKTSSFLFMFISVDNYSSFLHISLFLPHIVDTL